MINTIGIDIETTSDVDLVQTGVYRYVDSPDFTILLFAYKINNNPVEIIDCTKQKIPDKILKILVSPKWLKTAYNANFERICIQKYTGLKLETSQWECTMVRTSLLTLPLGLDACSTVLGTAPKDKTGKALIRLFSIKRTQPKEALDKWYEFKMYCAQDVHAEQDIRQKTIAHDIPEFERRIWLLDQKINDYGIAIDVDFVDNCLKLDKINNARILKRAKEITGIDNPNSVAQVKKWITYRTGEHIKSLSKGFKMDADILAEYSDVAEMLELRGQLAKTSVKKYVAMRLGVCSDGILRGLLQYYGANRTGRWAGRLVQVQNLVRNYMKQLDLARRLVKRGDFQTVDWIFPNTSEVLSQLIRTAFIPRKGYKFIISDFSAIEARVVAWLCNEKWRLDVFRTHGKIYEASASMMFNIPIEEITKELRTKGKIAELALGYGGAVNALERMGGGQMGLSIDDMVSIVKLWRRTSPNIRNFWYNIEKVVKRVVKTRRPEAFMRLIIYIKGGILFIQLPSGRRLAYLEPHLDSDEQLLYKGVNQINHTWGNITTWGGKLTENLVQAIARDCLADAMLRLDTKGYKICMHVHDEVVIEVPDNNDQDYIQTIDKIMAEEIPWAKGLPLKAASFEAYYYMKD